MSESGESRLDDVQGTGQYGDTEETKTISYPFEQYIVKVVLTLKNEFIGIDEIGINKDFLSHRQKLAALSSSGYHDVAEFYRGPEEE